MAVNLERWEKEIAHIQRRMLRDDLELILGFFGFKVKEK